MSHMKSSEDEMWFHKVDGEENCEEDKYPIVASVCPDGKGQETINFVFNKLATEGDHVVILNVLDNVPDLPQLPDSSLDKTEAVEAAWFDAHKHQAKQQLGLMLQGHQAQCDKLKIQVKFHIVRSKNAGESILEEAAFLRASFLVVASSAKSAFKGRMSPVAKFCLKSPPVNCTVMVVSSGSVVGTRSGESTHGGLARQLSFTHGKTPSLLSNRALSEVGRTVSEVSSFKSAVGKYHSRSSSLGSLQISSNLFSRKSSPRTNFVPVLEAATTSPTSSTSSGTDSGGFQYSFGRSQTYTGPENVSKTLADEIPGLEVRKSPKKLIFNGKFSPRGSGDPRRRQSLNIVVQEETQKRSMVLSPRGFPKSGSFRDNGAENVAPSPRKPPLSGKMGSSKNIKPAGSFSSGPRRSMDFNGVTVVLKAGNKTLDDNIIGVKSLSRQGSLSKTMAEMANMATNHNQESISALGLAAASGLARQGSGIPSARLAAMELASMSLGNTGRLSSNYSPNSVIHSAGLFSGSLKSLSGNFRSLMATKKRETEEGLLPLSSLIAACSVRDGSRSLEVSPRTSPRVPNSPGSLESSLSFGVKFFSYEEITAATNGFSQENLVGKGGFAEVFKGVLADGSKVAVKRLFQKKKSEIEFLSEVGIVSHVRHPNATRLLGYCIDESHRLLVYELLPNGSLDKNLHRKFRKTLDWNRRLKAAIGSAKGLQYLHHECPRRIIHRDVKSANILIADDYEAQICDFGLAKWIPERGAFSSLGPVEGTFGYMAPEYFMHGELNEKTDVYAFGIVLLEIITGRRPIEGFRPQQEQNLHAWALPYITRGEFSKVLDPRLKSVVDMPSLRRMCAATIFCLRYDPENRPPMGEVAQLLEDSSLGDEILQRMWPRLVAGGPEIWYETDDEASVGPKEYTESMYYRDMEQHMAMALTNTEGLVRST